MHSFLESVARLFGQGAANSLLELGVKRRTRLAPLCLSEAGWKSMSANVLQVNPVIMTGLGTFNIGGIRLHFSPSANPNADGLLDRRRDSLVLDHINQAEYKTIYAFCILVYIDVKVDQINLKGLDWAFLVLGLLRHMRRSLM